MKHADAPPAPPAAAAVFGTTLERARDFAGILAGAGIERGLLGPSEVARLWDRHLLNCAVIADLIDDGAAVGDVGSGAGLPGLVVALVRPDVSMVLIEPLARRAEFLLEAADTLGVIVRVIRGRAEDPAVRDEVGALDVVTSRAVARLDKVVRWSMPLLRIGGTMLAMKGDRAHDEISENRAALRSSGATDVEVVTCGADFVSPPTTVVVARRGAPEIPNHRRPSSPRRHRIVP